MISRVPFTTSGGCLICRRKLLTLRSSRSMWNSQARYVKLFQLDAISKPDNKVIVL
uniref:Uncharacterized protein n=1 Tax=Arundo donax TaxID=35708 RepID=A0A0A9EDP6_ARUDO